MMSTTQCTDSISITPIRLKDRAGDVLTAFKDAGVAIFKLLCELQVNHETRQWMKYLDDRILRDIGKTRAEVDAEANKPMWRH